MCTAHLKTFWKPWKTAWPNGDMFLERESQQYKGLQDWIECQFLKNDYSLFKTFLNPFLKKTFLKVLKRFNPFLKAGLADSRIHV